MLKKTAVIFMVMCGLVLFFIPAWGLDFKPGMYNITSTVKMPGMPAGSVPSQTITECLTKSGTVSNQETFSACQYLE